jgi:predicted transcriptional regulator
MAPKKNTKAADSINAKLALTIKVRQAARTVGKTYGVKLTTDAVRQSHTRLQIYTQDAAVRQGEADHHRGQHTTAEEE